MYELRLRPNLCIGCRTCELVCSQRHTGAFSRKTSSIYVDRIERKGDMKVTIFRENVSGHVPCDKCHDLKLPLCVKYCPAGVIAIR